MVRILRLLFAGILFPFISLAQSQAIFTCDSVDATNGDVFLNWNLSPDPCNGGVNIYTASSSSDPFTTKINPSVIPIGQTSFKHAGAGAQNHIMYYQIETVPVAGCNGGSVLSNIHSTISITSVEYSDPDKDTARVRWFQMGNANADFDLYIRPKGASTWTLVGTTKGVFFDDRATACEGGEPDYKVVISNGGCRSVSNVKAGLPDKAGPPPSEINNVTVDPLTGKTIINWSPNPDPDTYGYTINKTVNDIKYDFLTGRNNTIYTDNNAGSGIDIYSIFPVDQCSNPASSFSAVHNTIKANAKFDKCERAAEISWNPYIGWKEGVKEYEIYANDVLVATVKGNVNSYIHKDLLSLQTYTYRVRAIPVNSSLGFSDSHKVSVVTDKRINPQFLILKNIAIAGSQVEILARVDTSADVLKYRLLRSTSEKGPFVPVKSVAEIPAVPKSAIIGFRDNSADVQNLVYYYQVVAIDSCGGNSMISEKGHTILLKGEALDEFKNELNWNSYQLNGKNDSLVFLYRSVDHGNYSLVSQFDAPSTWFEDNVSDFTYGEGKFCYTVQIIQKKDTSGYISIGKSNEFCLTQQPKLFVPNTFVPKGKNAIFYPVNVYPDISTYYFVVYNRWGEKVFETNDPSSGWDGTLEGKDCDGGVYTYIITFTGTNGTGMSRKGTVTLLR